MSEKKYEFTGTCPQCNITTVADTAVYRANHRKGLRMKCGKCKNEIKVDLINGERRESNFGM